MTPRPWWGLAKAGLPAGRMDSSRRDAGSVRHGRHPLEIRPRTRTRVVHMNFAEILRGLLVDRVEGSRSALDEVEMLE